MKQGWLERLRNAIADRGRDLLKKRRAVDLRNPSHLCAELVSDEHGEASGVALAREALSAYEAMDEPGRLAFFEMIERDFGPDPGTVRKASARYLETLAVEDYLVLYRAVEPRRQELFRRLNMAPQGTAALVRMRADLVGLLRSHPDLRVVDADLHHLLGSWFNRGFLQLRGLNWDSPAALLEKLVSYESVHAIQGLEDLRRRLAGDRRCFAFCHPAMPDEPLIFGEVALLRGIPEELPPLLDPQGPLQDPERADTALFFSICNTQPGLRGISFGNFLIKQVVEELRHEFPWLTNFATLSPLPRFASSLRAALRREGGGMDPDLVEAILREHAGRLVEATGAAGASEALLRLLERDELLRHRPLLDRPLQQLAMAWLLTRGPRGPLDPEASFHLANGARLEALRPFADPSPRGLALSLGVMANYLYVPDDFEENHERFVETGEIPLGRGLSRCKREVEAARKASRRKGTASQG